jgi:hypothetical protein
MGNHPFLALVILTVLGGLVSESPSTRATISLHGTVFSSGYGTFLEGAKVTIRNDLDQLSASSDGGGQYEITHIPAGAYHISARCAGFRPYDSEVTLDSNANVDIPLQIGRYGSMPTIEGMVSGPGGKPLEGAHVEIISPFDKDVRLTATTQANGHYSVVVPVGGQYVLYASKPGFRAQSKVVVMCHGATERANLKLAMFNR